MLNHPSHCISISLRGTLQQHFPQFHSYYSFSFPHSSDQSLMVAEVVLSQVRQTLPSPSRMRRSWVLMMMSRRTPMTTAGVGISLCLSLFPDVTCAYYQSIKILCLYLSLKANHFTIMDWWSWIRSDLISSPVLPFSLDTHSWAHIAYTQHT